MNRQSQSAQVAQLTQRAREAYHQGKVADAERLFREALVRRPDDPDLLSSLGVVVKDLGRSAEAVGLWQKALKIAPRHALSHNNLGAMYRLQRQPLKAIEHLRRAIQLEPRDATAATNLAHALLDLGRIGEAEALARRVTERAPGNGDGHLMLGFALEQQAQIEPAIAEFLEAHRLAPRSPMPLGNALFSSLYGDRRDGAAILALHRELAAKIVPAGKVRTAWPNSRAPGRRLKIGYLSADLRRHPVGYFIEPILANHDPAQFEIVCYSTTTAPDAVTERLRAKVAQWRDCQGLPEERIIEAIEKDEIDILVDLSGHTAQNRVRVMAVKPAPLQALYVGYPSTTGLATVDWLIADARVCPPGHERFYSERVARLDGCFWCYQPAKDAPEPGEPPSARTGRITFGSYNALPKLSDTTLALWSRVLAAVPGSQLVLKALPFADPPTRERTLRRLVAAGADAARVHIEPPTEPDKFLAEYRRIDIGLDPVPYNGGTTTCESLWMGVPVVSLAGEPFFARMGAGLLHAVGLAELVAKNADEYVRIAAALAGDAARLAEVRRTLRPRMAASALCDGARAAREIEAAYREMWRAWIKEGGKSPQPGAQRPAATPRGDLKSLHARAQQLLGRGLTVEPEECARRILARAPEDPQAHLTLGFALAYQSRVEEAIAAFAEAHRLAPRAAPAISNLLYAGLYSDRRDAARVLAEHRELAVQIAPASTPRTRWRNSRDPKRRLRIGYLSPDLRTHPVSAFMEPVLAQHDRSAVEVFCYSTAPAPDAVTARLRALAPAWHECGRWPEARVAAQIEADGIDVLVDLAGHTGLNRAAVLRARPAPVQALYLGYPGTTGLPEMDYLIADAALCPPELERHCSERVLRLAGPHWSFRAPSAAPGPGEGPGRGNGHVTFGSFNALQKLSDATVDLWLRVLRAVPGSRLLLKALALGDPRLRERVRERLGRAGFEAARFDLLAPVPDAGALGEYRRIDIALDPTPYNGATTTCESLWMGVPVVTLRGERISARMGASLLECAGLPELIAGAPDDYVRIAAGLAADPARLATLRRELRGRIAGSPLCAAPETARALESAYRQMWQAWLDR